MGKEKNGGAIMKDGSWFFKCQVHACGRSSEGKEFDIRKEIQIPLHLAMEKNDAEKQMESYIEKHETAVGPNFFKQHFNLDNVEKDYLITFGDPQVFFEE